MYDPPAGRFARSKDPPSRPLSKSRAAAGSSIRPNPSPAYFGFHEIFHVLTVVGYATHYSAVLIASLRSA